MSKVRGADTLDRTMKAAGKALAGPGMTGALHRSGTVLLTNVRARTPRRTGTLAGSLRVVRPGGLSVAVEAGAVHARPIEGGVGARPGLPGGHNIRARRFLAGGAKASGPAVADAAAGAVQTVMRRVKGE